MFTILYARLRWKLRYLYYAAYLKFMDKHKPAQDKEFEHDVFLCYDSDDGLFVITLSRGLFLLLLFVRLLLYFFLERGEGEGCGN